MSLELLNEIIREPIDFSECLILYSNTKTNTKNLISSDKNIDISFIDLLKSISYLKTTSKKFLEDLLKLVEDKRLTGNEDILVISTDRNELALYFPVKNEKLITADFPISKHAYISAALSLYLIKYRYNPNSVQKIAKLRIAGYIS